MVQWLQIIQNLMQQSVTKLHEFACLYFDTHEHFILNFVTPNFCVIFLSFVIQGPYDEHIFDTNMSWKKKRNLLKVDFQNIWHTAHVCLSC